VLEAEINDFLLGDHPWLLTRFYQVKLIGDNQLAESLVRELFDLEKPPLKVSEGLAIGEVKHDDTALALAVVGGGYRFVLLSPRCSSGHVYRYPRAIS
jgi:hypothetical protein